jgi:hypothetical protein
VAGLAIAILFLLMVAAPCLVAMRSSREIGDGDEFIPEEFEADELADEAIAPEGFHSEPPVPVAADAFPSGARSAAQRANAVSLRELAVAAEVEALMAKDRADRAHWEALTSAARAASLRADAAAEAAQAASLAANRAIWAAETEFDYEAEYRAENHSSLDFPRSPASGRRAA